jgi:hypothetical protein
MRAVAHAETVTDNDPSRNNPVRFTPDIQMLQTSS